MTSSPIRTEVRFHDRLRQLSLRSLLGWGFGSLIVVGLLTVALLLLIGRLATGASTEYKGAQGPMAERASRSMDAWLRVRRFEKDFALASYRAIGVMEAKARYVTLAKTNLSDIRDHMAEMRRITGPDNPPTVQRLRNIETLVNRYEAEFLEFVDAVSRRGFLNSGLEGELRRTAEDASAIVAERRLLPLSHALVTLFRTGGDFAHSGKAEFVRQFADDFAQALRLARAASMPKPRQAALVGQIEKYAALFGQFVAATRDMESKRVAYLEVAQTLEPAIESLQYDMLRQAGDVLDGVDDRIDAATRVSAAVSLAAVLFGTAVAVFVSRRITAGSGRILEFAQRVANGRLDTRLPEVAGGEFGALESALNRMSDRLQEGMESLNRQARDLEEAKQGLETRVAQRTEQLLQSNRRLEESNRRIALLGEMTSLLQTARTQDEAGVIIAGHLSRLRLGHRGALYLHKASRNYVDLLAAWGDAGLSASFACNDCWALRRGRAHGSSEAGPACAHLTEAQAGHPYVCLPLLGQGDSLGLLHLEFADEGADDGADDGADGEGARQDETHFASRVSEQLGLALANLKLRETLREQSIRDHLTTLFNRRYLEESLARELARAERESRSLAVLMLDVDHFKRFNDIFGHDAGDMVLSGVGRLLRACCRVTDLPCRFGGEEFTVALPGTTLDQARQWADRFMTKLRSTELTFGHDTLPPVTMSLGLAMYPDHGQDVETLLQAADLALYDAKHAGRDRLVVSGEHAQNSVI